MSTEEDPWRLYSVGYVDDTPAWGIIMSIEEPSAEIGMHEDFVESVENIVTMIEAGAQFTALGKDNVAWPLAIAISATGAKTIRTVGGPAVADLPRMPAHAIPV